MNPSIFNDVLGPVMRGPSSSHCAAALRIGRMCYDLMRGQIDSVKIDFDSEGSLATTHKSQGSDMGLFGGFLGWTADDARLPNYEDAIARNGMDIQINIFDYGAEHPNTYRVVLQNRTQKHEVTAISTGGGMIEIIAVDGAETSMIGDYYELLVYTSNPTAVCNHVQHLFPSAPVKNRIGTQKFVQVSLPTKPVEAILKEIQDQDEVIDLVCLDPVLPILSSPDLQVPFTTAEQMLVYNEDKKLALWELALAYESARGNISKEEVYQKMEALVAVMRNSIKEGLAGTTYEDRILGNQSANFADQMSKSTLIEGDVLNTIVLYVSTIMEVKSSMGVIVAAPTAGACAALPGAILGTSDATGATNESTVRGMLAAGIVGVFIAGQASFAAEVGGCQAECGSGSCMAGAALVTLMGGTVEQALSAASLALQNSLGMICDPIANRVEAPCLGKNVMAASNALSCANMALADYDHLIPLDQVIQTMARVSTQMARELRCTALGGLAITEAAKKIEAKLGQESLTDAALRFKIC